MKQLIHDIRAAWPRERRFTWRGWVLLGSLGCLSVAAWRGWDPVHQCQSVLMRFGWDTLLAATVNFGIMPWWETAFPTLSFLALPGIFAALGCFRPSHRWWWYLAACLGVWLVPVCRFKVYVWLSDVVGWGAGVSGLVTFLVVALIWGAGLGVLLRWFIPVLLLPFLTMIEIVAGWLLDDIRLTTTPGFMMPDWVGIGWGFGYETLVYHLCLALGLTLIALRSWHVPPEYLCPNCRYDRRGLQQTAPCPECGTGGLSSAAATSQPN